jgi:GAF domain-containing protein
LWLTLWGPISIPQDLINLLLLAYGILGWFVFEAVRRPRVVSVSIPLRRITVFGLLLSVPAFFAHHQLEYLREMLELPAWGWIALASALLFLIGRAHDLAVDLADHLFNRAFRRETKELAELGRLILRADNIDDVEHLVTVAPLRLLGLASVVVFREVDGAFRRRTDGFGWDAANADVFDPRDVVLNNLATGAPFAIDADDAERLGFPRGIAAPTLAVPVRNRLRWFAVALYGPHATGADLTSDERELLGQLADSAALAYAHAETEALRREVAKLRRRLSDARVST